MKYSIVLPAYCEADNLKILIPAVCHTMSQYAYEIIVVDDNSPDNTAEVIHNLKTQHLPVNLIIRTKDRGFANSIKTGIEAAKGEYVIIMDSDGNHNPNYLPFMCDNSVYYPCIVASRFQYGGGMSSRFRQGCSWLFNIFVRITTGGYVTDSLYGFFLIRKEILLQLDFKKIFWGYGDYAIRLLYFIQKNHTPILQFPAQNGERLYGTENSRLLSTFIKYFRESILLVIRERILGGQGY